MSTAFSDRKWRLGKRSSKEERRNLARALTELVDAKVVVRLSPHEEFDGDHTSRGCIFYVSLCDAACIDGRKGDVREGLIKALEREAARLLTVAQQVRASVRASRKLPEPPAGAKYRVEARAGASVHVLAECISAPSADALQRGYNAEAQRLGKRSRAYVVAVAGGQ